MTIRDHLKRRAAILFVLWWLYFALLSAIIYFTAQHLAPMVVPFLFLLFLAPLVPLHFAFRCPCCRGSLSALIAHFGPLAFLSRQVKYCPSCGVDLDGMPKASERSDL